MCFDKIELCECQIWARLMVLLLGDFLDCNLNVICYRCVVNADGDNEVTSRLVDRSFCRLVSNGRLHLHNGAY